MLWQRGIYWHHITLDNVASLISEFRTICYLEKQFLTEKAEKIRDEIDKLVPYSDAKKWTQGMAEALDNRRSKVYRKINEFCTEQKKKSRRAARDEPEVIKKVGEHKYKVSNEGPTNSVTNAYSSQRHTRMMAAIETIEKDLERGETFTETLRDISFALGGALIKRGDRPGKKAISGARKALEAEGIFEETPEILVVRNGKKYFRRGGQPIKLVDPEELPFGRMFLMLKVDADHVKEKIVKFQEISGTRKFSYDDWIEFALVEKRILEMPGKYLSKKSTPGMEIPPQLLKYTTTMLESLESIKRGQSRAKRNMREVGGLLAALEEFVNDKIRDPKSFPQKNASKNYPKIDTWLERI